MGRFLAARTTAPSPEAPLRPPEGGTTRLTGRFPVGDALTLALGFALGTARGVVLVTLFLVLAKTPERAAGLVLVTRALVLDKTPDPAAGLVFADLTLLFSLDKTPICNS